MAGKIWRRIIVNISGYIEECCHIKQLQWFCQTNAISSECSVMFIWTYDTPLVTKTWNLRLINITRHHAKIHVQVLCKITILNIHNLSHALLNIQNPSHYRWSIFFPPHPKNRLGTRLIQWSKHVVGLLYTRVNKCMRLFSKLQVNMRLIPNMHLIAKGKINHTSKTAMHSLVACVLDSKWVV